MTSLFQAAPEWTLTAVPYGSPDARVLVHALHQEQLATYGTADDPAALGLYTACGYEPVRSYVPGRDPEINRALRKDIRQKPASHSHTGLLMEPG